MPTVHCQSCRRLLDVGGAFVGRQVMCPACLGPVSVPLELGGIKPRWRRWRWVTLGAGAVAVVWWLVGRGR